MYRSISIDTCAYITMNRNIYAGFEDFYQISMAINDLSGIYLHVFVKVYVCICMLMNPCI
jgi:hypothetical protein